MTDDEIVDAIFAVLPGDGDEEVIGVDGKPIRDQDEQAFLELVVQAMRENPHIAKEFLA